MQQEALQIEYIESPIGGDEVRKKRELARWSDGFSTLDRSAARSLPSKSLLLLLSLKQVRTLTLSMLIWSPLVFLFCFFRIFILLVSD